MTLQITLQFLNANNWKTAKPNVNFFIFLESEEKVLATHQEIYRVLQLEFINYLLK